jgi:hypothetical protein
MIQDYTPPASAARTRRAWTEEETCTAKALRAKGWTYRQIAKALSRAHGSVQGRLNPEQVKEQNRRKYERNPEKAKERAKRWREQNSKRKRELDRRWREQNSEQVKQRNHRCYEQSREKVKERAKRWCEQNPERTTELRRKRASRWREQNREKTREVARRRDALKRGRNKAALTPLTISAKAKRFDLFGSACAYCGFSEKLTVDHILALASGGLDEPDNIAPACRSCNSKKHTKPVEAWYRAQPFFCEARWELIKQHCPGATGQLSLAMPA